MDQSETRIRLDDTINILRKSNLSVEFSKSQEFHLEDIDLRQELEERYGSKLLGLLETHFESMVKNGEYICQPNT